MLVAGPDGPQVVTIDPETNAVALATQHPTGVTAYEWSPDGKFLAYLSRGGPPIMGGAAPVANRVGTQPPATRLWVIDRVANTGASLTPQNQYVDSIAWSPNSKEIAHSFALVRRLPAPYSSKIFAVTPTACRRARLSTAPA